jgi:hypothetical protein
MHLLTREAFLNAYIPLLSEKGIIAIHTTNRYINLVPTIAAVAESVGYVAVAHTNVPAKNALSHTTMWALVMKPDYAGQFDGRTPMTEIYTAEDGAYMWTDDKSSILPALSLIGSNKLKE